MGKPLEVIEKAGINESSYTDEGKIIWTNSTSVDAFQEVITTHANYQDINTLIKVFSQSGLLEEWNYRSLEKEEITIVRSFINDANSNNKFKEKIKLELTEFLNTGFPFESIWQLMASNFVTGRLIRKGETTLLQFKINDETITFAGVIGIDGSYIVNELLEGTGVDDFLQTELDSPTALQSNMLNLRLVSEVPVDELIISDIGIKTDSFLSVNLYGNETKNWAIDKWRKLLDENNSETNVIFKNDILLLHQFYQEKVKGDFPSFELTNRPFLIESIANLRKNNIENQRYIALGNGEIKSKESFVRPSAPSKRVFVFDLEGFSHNRKDELIDLAKINPDLVSVIDGDLTIFNQDDADELIWITTLSENEIKQRLEDYSSKSMLKNLKRLRVLNLNNSVYDLGGNLFIDNPNLQIIGAYPQTIDFETISPLLKSLISNKDNKELDSQIFDVSQKISKEYQEVAITPQKLRVSRALKELSLSWEEVYFQASTPNQKWKIYGK